MTTEIDPRDLRILRMISELRKRGVAQVKLELGDYTLEAVISPEPDKPLAPDEIRRLIEDPKTAPDRARELQAQLDEDLYGAS